MFNTLTPLPTRTDTRTPFLTPTETPTDTPIPTASDTPTATVSREPSATFTSSNTPTITNTPTATRTHTPSNTPTATLTPTPRPAHLIAFSSDDDGDDIFELYLMNPDGSNVAPVVAGTADAIVNGWSPDGNYLLFNSVRFYDPDANPGTEVPPGPGPDQMYVVTSAGKQERQLTSLDGENNQGDWSPD
ncbi:MAG: hypothetical protein AAB217_21090, partial [Chloroflexota bacterium]